LAKERSFRLIDATCPVVLHLQRQIRKTYENSKGSGLQLVIFGKPTHAEVIGLAGQTENTAIVIEGEDELDRLNFQRPIVLFSQTTQSIEAFQHLIESISRRMQPGVSFSYVDTICRQVANRLPYLQSFCSHYDTVLFVSGAHSSNGKALFEACLKANSCTFFISDPEEVKEEWVRQAERIGICGATSTPFWLMDEVKKKVEYMLADR
jgi:4-hydroxy-3-methylbut-2-enyl diphosphate reductase